MLSGVFITINNMRTGHVMRQISADSAYEEGYDGPGPQNLPSSSIGKKEIRTK